ncbi:MAG: AbiV family abortive infection protein [Geobacteraceae bacterium]|nr:AbiV family abortive infection protein [Geobacteraceae bacterium]
MSKRKYRNKLDFIEDAFRACWTNANDLVASAKLLLDSGFNGLALSVSVLALEELGKLFCIDGLLFARSDDHKAEAYVKSLKSHATKLSSLTLLPYLLGNIAGADSRLKSETRFAQTVSIAIKDLQERGNVVFRLLPNSSFQDLDNLKQQGFYAQPYNNVFKAPSSAINKETSEAVYSLAWRATITLDFLLKDGNLNRYITTARMVREKMTEKQQHWVERMGKEFSESSHLSEETEPSNENESSWKGTTRH